MCHACQYSYYRHSIQHRSNILLPLTTCCKGTCMSYFQTTICSNLCIFRMLYSIRRLMRNLLVKAKRTYAIYFQHGMFHKIHSEICGLLTCLKSIFFCKLLRKFPSKTKSTKVYIWQILECAQNIHVHACI